MDFVDSDDDVPMAELIKRENDKKKAAAAAAKSKPKSKPKVSKIFNIIDRLVYDYCVDYRGSEDY